MTTLLPSSAANRIDALRRQLTLDLFTRYGEFSGAVHGIRSRWDIVAQVRIPPTPTEFDGPWSFVPSGLFNDVARCPHGWATLEIATPERLFELGVSGWLEEIQTMYDRVVPESCRVLEPHPEIAWITFLSSCLFFDPPPMQLLDYAVANHHFVLSTSPRLYAIPIDGDLAISVGEIAREAYVMVQPPIEPVRDAAAVEKAWIEYYESLLKELAALLYERTECDLEALVREVLERAPEIRTRLHDRLLGIHPQPLIRVRPETTEEDVRGAYTLIRQTLPPFIRGRPTRDPLISVQCAIWHKSGLSLAEIARRLGRKPKQRPGQGPTSETARLYVAEGKKILVQRNAAAYIGETKIA